MIEKRIFTEKDLYENVKVKKYGDKYRARVRVANDTTTRKYSYRAIYGSNELEVKVKVREFIEGEIKGQNEQQTHDELLTTNIEKWLYNEKHGTIKAGSFDRLEQIYLNQIKQHIQGIRTKDAKAESCKAILQVNLAKGYSYSTLLKIYRFLKEFFKARVADGSMVASPMNTVKFYSKEFVRTNQANIRDEREKAKAKKDTGADLTAEEEGLAFSKLRMEDKTEIRFFTDEEIAKMRDVAYNGYYIRWTTKNGKQAESGPFMLKQAKYFLFILNTGIRKGEAVALKYSDIDFEHKTMYVQRNITTAKKRDKNGNAMGGIRSIEGTPKTKGSFAVVPINDTAITILKEMLKDEPKGYSGYIANEEGKAIGESALRKRFDNLLRQAGIEHCGMHSLRHTFASKLYEATHGDSKLVSELVRHSSVSFTEEIYIHIKDKYKQDTIANFSI